MTLCIDRIYRAPRIWSNRELAKFAHFFTGLIINVSGWRDEDKEGNRYKNYFINADEYCISNIEGYRGFSGLDNEIYLNLEEDLPENLIEKFDVVFCHTVLEHIFDIKKAFDNLCTLSKDVIIIVVPFIQEEHLSPSYGDYWRFTPQGIEENFKRRGFELLYLSVTPYKSTSKYIFAIASKNPKKWEKKIPKVRQAGKVSWIKNPAYCRIIWLLRRIFLIFFYKL